MKEELKLEDRTVDNTNPVELRRLLNEESDIKISGFQRKKEFSIVGFLFFSLIYVIFYNTAFYEDYSIFPCIIAFVFSVLIIAFELCIKDTLIRRRIVNLIL